MQGPTRPAVVPVAPWCCKLFSLVVVVAESVGDVLGGYILTYIQCVCVHRARQLDLFFFYV